MIKLRNKSDCAGCFSCVNACPKKCIVMQADEEGFSYPRVDASRCVECGLCERVCPMLAPRVGGGAPQMYAAVNNDEAVRAQSSSGGIFTLLARSVIARGGVVFGAAFGEGLEVLHIEAKTEEELARIRCSKYVQSRIGDMYARAKAYLNGGTPVLFTGTPCQIHGLLKYLGREYDDLLTQDIICHGVPSPSVWQRYLSYLGEQHGAEPISACFRQKIPGSKKYNLSFGFENGEKYEVLSGNDPYMQAFLRNYSLRPSCYSCRFRGKKRVSDITLADYWGLEKVHPDFHNEGDTSLLWVNTDKGKRILEEILPQIKAIPTEFSDAIAENPSAVRSFPSPANRKRFMKNVMRKEFTYAVSRYCRPTAYERCKRFGKRAIKKVFSWCYTSK